MSHSNAWLNDCIHRPCMRFLMLFLCLIFPVLTSSGSEPEAGGSKPRRFQAGAATSNITPRLGISINGHFSDRKAAHVHDELHARCLVLDDGTNRLALVVCDSCMIPREVTDEAKAQIAKRVGLPPERVLISATHTYSSDVCRGVSKRSGSRLSGVLGPPYHRRRCSGCAEPFPGANWLGQRERAEPGV